jgi:hypothetical protein
MIPAILTQCAGFDIGKRNLAVCLMVGPAKGEPKVEVREFSTFNADLEAMKKWLVQAAVRTSSWKAPVRTGSRCSIFWRIVW